MKAILLTCSTGQGHNSAAGAVAEALAARGVSCETKDALSFLGERASEVITNAFVNIAVKTPRAFGVMYQTGEKLSENFADRMKSPVYLANALYAQNLRRYLEENRIDFAVCPHLFPAEALTYLKRNGGLAARCCFVSTDYTCIPFLEETDLDTVFVPDASLLPEFTGRGMDAAKLVPTGIPVAHRFCADTPRAEARRQLGFPENAPVFLVMTGGEGCGDAVTLTSRILAALGGADARVVVLPGRNRKLRAALLSVFGDEPRVCVESFTEKVALFMDACDVLLSKPGGISSTEAAAKRVPLIHTPPIPGCETRNAEFFSQRGMSILAPDEESAAANAVRLARDEGQKRRMREAQSQYIDRAAAEKIAAVLLGG
jgi:processive 1,2-diacylglycerol beta-glucosyltransferase